MSEWEQAVAERIRKTMKAKRITQQDLAEYLGIRQYSVSRMLSGTPFPSAEQLCRIAERLDASVYYLLGVQEESYRELPRQAAKVADAYTFANPGIQFAVERILQID